MQPRTTRYANETVVMDGSSLKLPYRYEVVVSGLTFMCVMSKVNRLFRLDLGRLVGPYPAPVMTGAAKRRLCEELRLELANVIGRPVGHIAAEYLDMEEAPWLV
jgi:hypothetical protein